MQEVVTHGVRLLHRCAGIPARSARDTAISRRAIFGRGLEPEAPPGCSNFPPEDYQMFRNFCRLFSFWLVRHREEFSSSRRRPCRANPFPGAGYKPRLEDLEDRTLLAVQAISVADPQ